MGHGPCLFRESDVRRAIKAARSAGIEIGRVEMNKDGAIIVVAAKPGGATETELNPWDEVIDAAKQKRAS